MLWLYSLIILSGDVETNPGPDPKLYLGRMSLTTLNVRGLKKETKFKQLLNRFHKQFNLNLTTIITLQETHVEYNNLNYTWSGKHIFTPGSGSKGGLITLLSNNINVLDDISLNNEAQISVLQIIENNKIETVILANIHSPCAHNNLKTEYFKEVFNQIDLFRLSHDEPKIIFMGDFNTTFYPTDRQNTLRSNAEVKVAEKIQSFLDNLELIDSWPQGDTNMTWRHSDKMSKIDRIYVSHDLINNMNIKTDWSITESDHCAVTLTINETQLHRPSSRIVRLDTRFMSNALARVNFLKELDDRMSQLQECSMNPHQKLEFLKMSIRSIAIEQASNYKKKSEAEFKIIKDQINFWQKSFEASEISCIRELAMKNLDKATTERDKFLDEKGRHLSEWAKSRWYQEGERGTKYFLNMLRAKSNKLDMSQLKTSDGTTIKDPVKINQEVENFYKQLYERGNKRESNKALSGEFLKHMTKIPDDNIKNITAPLTLKELHDTLKSCADSAPGPDGIPYSVINLTWKYFGPMLLDSWFFSIETDTLAPSHTDSYLRLLPKEGKDLDYLKNWRPITLSNCDIKLITKSLSQRLGTNLDSVISQQQTAYLKNRQITDNLNLMQHLIEKSNDQNSSAMIVSLDAEKAFDSVEHWYIKEILHKIGLTDFCKTFELLYKGQEVKIVLNQNIAGSYNIKNGVKQGDALSCILFILGIEPLIKNIENDNSVVGVSIGNTRVPKIVSYADDVACLIKPTQNNLDAIFRNYEYMTNLSGLKLNADKTEIIGLKCKDEYDVTYLHLKTKVRVSEMIKINGLHLSFDTKVAITQNMTKLLTCLESQLKRWSKRYLSILGKIQIFKTFGLSQILFIATTTIIPQNVEKKITNLIYKFIWNNDMSTNKAPDRIKRTILSRKIKELGFGMLDYREVINSIRQKMLHRLRTKSLHPMHDIIANNVSSSIINIRNINSVNTCIDTTIRDLNKKWKMSLKNPPSDQIPLLNDIVRNEYIGNVLIPRYSSNRLGRALRHDKLQEITDINHPILSKLDKNVTAFLKANWHVNSSQNKINLNALYPTRSKILTGDKVTSKSIRMLEHDLELLSPKSLSNTTEEGLRKLGRLISKLTNSKLQTILLRVLNGDVYAKSRMLKFGMIESDECERCGKRETISHLLLECNYVNSLWSICSKLTSIPTINLNTILGYHDYHDKTTITVHCEIIRRLLAINRPTVNQFSLLKSVMNKLIIVEKGVSKPIIKEMKQTLEIITQSDSMTSTTVPSLPAPSSSEADPDPEASDMCSS